ncbi:MAG: ribosomal protein S18-alanine N-acetyltransferase [Lachnospiraceae bacterium]|nr:ribosomal protein S18-alanine N-acetyltransferase [Lachnospiraceae bacterium]
MRLIRRMSEKDLTQAEEIGKSLNGESWSAKAFRDSMDRPEACFMVLAEEEDDRSEVLGYCVGTHVLDEAEIVSVAVRPDLRGRGLGKELLGGYVSCLKDLGIHHVVLEVREGNVPARKLYEGAGFRSAGIRKNFYSQPDENAVTMCLEM